MGGANYEDDSNSTRGGGYFLDNSESSFTLYECRCLDEIVVIKAEYCDSIVAVDELETDAESWIVKLRSGFYGIYPAEVRVVSIDDFCLDNSEINDLLSFVLCGGNANV